MITARKLLGVRHLLPTRQQALSSDSATSAALTSTIFRCTGRREIYDYEKEIYGNTGFARNTVLSMTGGNEKTTFYFSVAQKDEDGIVKNTGYSNTSLRLNVDHQDHR